MNDREIIKDLFLIGGLTLPFGILLVKYLREQIILYRQISNTFHAGSIMQTEDIPFLSDRPLTHDSFHKQNLTCKNMFS
jgi:hypothetical protein